MKTLELDLKKKVLIIENAEHGSYFPPSIIDYTIENENGEWKLLCKGSELTKEIASELMDKSIYTGLYAHYVYKIPVNTYCYNSAIPSFISAVESKGFYWLENPIPEPEIQGGYAEDGSFIGGYDDNWINEWQEAEEKTFRNPLIFVKK